MSAERCAKPLRPHILSLPAWLPAASCWTWERSIKQHVHKMAYSAGDIAATRGLQAFTYTYTSMATFWTYDYACSLDEEWMFLHRSRWTKVKGLYIFTRYVPFIFLALNLCRSFIPNENPGTCQMLDIIGSGFSLISVPCSGSFFVLRTLALWNGNRIVLVAMLFTALAFFAASIGTSFKTLTSSNGSRFHLPPPLFTYILSTSTVVTSVIPGITGCYHTSDSLFIPYLLLFVFQLGLVCLTLIRAIRIWRTVNSPLYGVLVKHNIFYYASGLLLSAVNVLTSLLFPNSTYHSISENFQFFMLPILATRMHLHLSQVDRNVHRHNSDVIVSIPLSDMSFAGSTA
ncbi:uncharacterized protein EDB91DRAFT_387173 [Suillus paluster]|uniref:uncharacterized protein n=1 Tax=Suillus paluster TaxID=48578 RepID=UPI001B870487|nr:uncharacterized protein EDB91DRAFT_387173 [Suillus paluster]KAG1739475.1 hypothetical protein EDB91DRAFT_387173 [Suillus paluster]